MQVNASALDITYCFDFLMIVWPASNQDRQEGLQE